MIVFGNMRDGLRLLIVIAVFCAPARVAHGGTVVLLDFGPGWVNSLNMLTTTAGVAAFTPTERGAIEGAIQGAIHSVFSAYDVTFVTSPPAGTYERIDYGATEGGDADPLGGADLDFRNLGKGQTARVFSKNFHPFIELEEPRDKQIAELAAALAGTGAHELGHSFGLRHHDAYGDARIKSSDGYMYATGGVQNESIMATGTTGISESEREVPRRLNRWENVILEAALDLTPNPLGLSHDEAATATDVGDTAGTAFALDLAPLAISNTTAALVQARNDPIEDTDVYSFVGRAGELLTAGLWSIDRFPGDFFNSYLTLVDRDGTTVLAENDNVLYDNDLFNFGTTHHYDAFLLNIPLREDGTYYLSVTRTFVAGDDPGSYNLLFATGSDPTPSGDVDLDGDTDFQDFLLLQVGFGITSGAARTDGDLDNDDDVDFADYLTLSLHFGEAPLDAGALAAEYASRARPPHLTDCDAALYAGEFITSSTAAVPEPSAGLLVITGACAIVCLHGLRGQRRIQQRLRLRKMGIDRDGGSK